MGSPTFYIGPDGTMIPRNPAVAAAEGAAQGAWNSAPVRALRNVASGAGHVLGAPARAVAAVGQNISGVGQPIDVSDAVIYGQDMNTGRAPESYGALISEYAPEGFVRKSVRLAGDLATDPVVLAGGVAAAAAPVAEQIPIKAAEQAVALRGAQAAQPLGGQAAVKAATAQQMRQGNVAWRGFGDDAGMFNGPDPTQLWRGPLRGPRPPAPGGAGAAAPRPPSRPISPAGEPAFAGYTGPDGQGTMYRETGFPRGTQLRPRDRAAYTDLWGRRSDGRPLAEVLDRDLVYPSAETQNRVYSFPNQMRQAAQTGQARAQEAALQQVGGYSSPYEGALAEAMGLEQASAEGGLPGGIPYRSVGPNPRDIPMWDPAYTSGQMDMRRAMWGAPSEPMRPPTGVLDNDYVYASRNR